MFQKVNKRITAFVLFAIMLISTVAATLTAYAVSGEKKTEVTAAETKESDFSSKRLIVMTDDASVIQGKGSVIGEYGEVYLLQFETAKETMEAYASLKDKVTAVEPDIVVEAASTNKGSDIQINETENPVEALNGLGDAKAAKNNHGVIALIDTGVKKHDNVIDRVSVADDALEGNGHGDAMVKAIVSQDQDAKILSIRAMDDEGFGTISSLVAAMEYAIAQDVDIINLSVYARTTLSTSVLKQEILKADEAGITVVGAAGNDGQDVTGYMPGAVEEAYIIGAANEDGSKMEGSNFGATVDYNVVAGSTSEATALFTGFISANGIDAVTDVVNQGLIYATDYITEESPDDTDDSVDLIFRPVGEGSFTYDNGKDAPETIDFEKLYPIEESETVQLKFDQTAYVFIQDDESHFVGTYTKHEAGDVMDLELTTKTGYVVWVVFDEETATEWMDLYDSGDEELFQTASSVTYYRKVKDDKTACGQFKVDGRWAFCTDHYETTPPKGTAIESIKETSNAKLKKVLYYGFGGPGSILGTSDADWMQTTIAAHIAVQGKNAGYEEHRKFWKDIQDLAAAPSGFKVYIAYTKGDYQDLAYWTYNPTTYTNISVSKSWSDYNNESGARPSSVNVGLYRSTKSPVSTSGSAYKTVTLNSSNKWSYTWEDLVHKDGSTTYYYAVKETSVPKYYSASYTQPKCTEGDTSAKVTNTIQEAYLKLNKDSADQKISGNNENYSLKDAEYTVYTTRSGDTLSGKVGVLTTDGNGETNTLRLLPKTYYIKETKPPKGFEQNDQIYSVTLSTGNTKTKPYVLNVDDVPKTAQIDLIKTSSMPECTDGSDLYSLAGAEYSVYKNASCTQYVGKMVTDEEGKASMSGLALNKYWVKETKAPAGYTIDAKVYELDLTKGGTGVVESEDMPILDPAAVLLFKVDKETGGIAQNNGTLAGAQFEVKFYGVISDTDPALNGEKPLRTWIFETDEDGYLEYRAPFLVDGDDLYLGPDGEANLPYGTLTFKEIKAPEGYLINDDVIVMKTNGYGGTSIVYQTPTMEEDDLEMRVTKIDATTGKPVSGVKFVHTMPDGSTKEYTTDENGFIDISCLEYGTHKLKEKSAPAGFAVNTAEVEFKVAQDNSITIVKGNAAATDTNGKVSVEVADDGCVEVRMENKAAPFRILVHKTNEDNKVLSGAEFTLYSDASCKKVITKGTTNSKGELYFNNLIVGTTYYMKETKAPAGYRIPVNADGSDIVYKLQADSKVEDGKFTFIVNNKSYTSDEGTYCVTGTAANRVCEMTVLNYTGQQLPETGSSSTLILIGAGVVLVAAAGVIALKRRKR